MSSWAKASLVAQAMGHTDAITRAVVPPLHLSTTYLRDPDNAYSSGYVYGRPDNATVRDTEAVIAMLEEAKAGALLFSSGMAAATACFQALQPGDTSWLRPSCTGRCATGCERKRRAGACKSILSRRTISPG
jgi:cystathionine gamma-synthase